MSEQKGEEAGPRSAAGRVELGSWTPFAASITMGDLSYVLLRYKYLLAALAFASLVVIALLQLVLTPRYTAGALVAVKENERPIVVFGSDRDNTPVGDHSEVRAVIEHFRSPDLARDVIARANTAFWGGFMHPDEDPGGETRMLWDFLSRVSVSQVDQSNLVSVQYTSPNPDIARRVVDFMIEEFMERQIKTGALRTEQANKILRTRVTALAEKVREADTAVAAFKAKYGVVDVSRSETGRTDLLTFQLSNTSDDVIKANTEYETLKAQYATVQSLISSGKIREALSQMNTEPGNKILTDEADVTQQLVVTRSRFGPNHPDTMEMQSQAQSILRDMNRVARQQLQVLASNVSIASARYQDLLSRSKDLQGQVGKLTERQVELTRLEMEATSSRDLYQTFLNRISETDQRGLELPVIEVVSHPVRPVEPSFPNMRLIQFLVALIAGSIACLAVIASEIRTRGVRTLGEIERNLGIRGLALTPNTPPSSIGVVHLNQAIVRQPYSFFSESVRSLGTQVMMPSGDASSPKIIMLSSAFENDGKSTLSASLATHLAQGNHRVLLIDCDLRRPSIHRLFGLNEQPGLSDFAAGKALLHDCIRPSPIPDLLIMTAGSATEGVDTILGSPSVRQLLPSIRDEFDYIILDTSPLLVVADALSLAGAVDTVLLIARWNRTKAASLLSAYNRLLSVGAKVAGAVLTKVDMPVYARYEEGKSAFNQKRYQRYVRDSLSEGQVRPARRANWLTKTWKGNAKDARARNGRVRVHRH